MKYLKYYYSLSGFAIVFLFIFFGNVINRLVSDDDDDVNVDDFFGYLLRVLGGYRRQLRTFGITIHSNVDVRSVQIKRRAG